MKAPPLFSPGLWRFGWRYLTVHRWQSLLMVLGIALGVAVMVAIDLANASAGRAFELSTQAITGKATHQIVGGAQGVDETLFAQLRRSELDVVSAPLITAYVSSPQLGSRPLQLMGIDPFSEAPFRNYFGSQSTPPLAEMTAFLTRPGAVLLSRQLVERYALKPGDSIEIEIGGRLKQVFLAGVIDPPDALSRRTLEGLVLADVSTAQELTGKPGYLERIDLIVRDPAQLTAIQQFLPAGLRLVSVTESGGTLEQMTAAFRVNLAALSMLALVVGLFLIYNTMTFSVVQRRPLFGTLRCLGVTRREIFSLVVSEALAVGVIGSILGVGLGILMGRNTVGMVTQTINDLYFTTTVQAIGIPLESLIKGFLIGLAATVTAAAFPAWEAASVPPQAALSRSGLESKARQVVTWAALGGLGLIVVGVVLFAIPTNDLFLGLSGTFSVVVGFAMLSALVMLVFMRAIAPVLGRWFGFIGRMAPRSLVNSISRTAVAVAALMVAVAVTIGVTLMIESFRYTVTLWLEQTLQGDIYVSAPTLTANIATEAVDEGVIQQLPAWPGVRRVDLLRSIIVDSTLGPIQLSATDNDRQAYERQFIDLAMDPAALWPAMQAGGVLISEPLANRLRLKVGESVRLFTVNGWKDYPVVAEYYDYSSSEGGLMMTLAVYRRDWQDNAITAIGLRLDAGVSPDEVAKQLQDGLVTAQRLIIRPNLALRRDVMEVFDQTFAITAALRILATVVAFIGVLNTLLLMQLEKQREVGILRALGLTGGQLWKLTMLETGLMGLIAGLLAAPTGYVLAMILIYVINRRSFGWTLQLALPPSAFLQALGIAVLAALLAGIYPAWRMSRKMTIEAIRDE